MWEVTFASITHKPREGKESWGYILTVIILKKTLRDANESFFLKRDPNIIWKHAIRCRSLVPSYTALAFLKERQKQFIRVVKVSPISGIICASFASCSSKTRLALCKAGRSTTSDFVDGGCRVRLEAFEVDA